MVEINAENKMTLKDVRSQNFRDIVYMNEIKGHATAP